MSGMTRLAEACPLDGLGVIALAVAVATAQFRGSSPLLHPLRREFARPLTARSRINGSS